MGSGDVGGAAAMAAAEHLPGLLFLAFILLLGWWFARGGRWR